MGTPGGRKAMKAAALASIDGELVQWLFDEYAKLMREYPEARTCVYSLNFFLFLHYIFSPFLLLSFSPSRSRCVVFPRLSTLASVHRSHAHVLRPDRSAVLLELHGYGKVVSVPHDATAFANRGPMYNVNCITRWKDATLDDKVRVCAHALDFLLLQSTSKSFALNSSILLPSEY